MKLTIEANGKRVLILRENEIGCNVCSEKEWNNWYFCEQDNKIYCKDCIEDSKGCSVWKNHIDYNIDEVKIDNFLLNEDLKK